MNQPSEISTVIQLRPKRKPSVKGGTNASPTKITAIDTLRACMGVMEMRLSQLATLLACAEENMIKIETIRSDASIKELMAQDRMNKLSHLISVSVDICEKTRNAYDMCSEVSKTVMQNPVASR